MDAAFLPVLAIVSLITVLPLFVILPTAPPIFDDDPQHPVHAPLFRGWRISVTVARNPGLESERP